MGLEINRDKTQVFNLKEGGIGLHFLRFTFMYDRDIKGRGNRYLNVFPSSKVMSREHECLREMNGVRLCFKPLLVILKEINRHLIGWNNCSGLGIHVRLFGRLTALLEVDWPFI